MPGRYPQGTQGKEYYVIKLIFIYFWKWIRPDHCSLSIGAKALVWLILSTAPPQPDCRGNKRVAARYQDKIIHVMDKHPGMKSELQIRHPQVICAKSLSFLKDINYLATKSQFERDFKLSDVKWQNARSHGAMQ